MTNFMDWFTAEYGGHGKCGWCHTTAVLEEDPQQVGRNIVEKLCHECFVTLCNSEDQKFAQRCPDRKRRDDFIDWAISEDERIAEFMRRR